MPASGARTTRFGIRTGPMWKGSVRAGDGMRLLALRVAAFRSGVRGRRGVRGQRGEGAVDAGWWRSARALPPGETPPPGGGPNFTSHRCEIRPTLARPERPAVTARPALRRGV